MIPARYAPIAFGFVLSGLMSLLVSGISVWRNGGPGDPMLTLWIGAWLISWAIAFPTVLVVAPVARRIVARVTRVDAGAR